MENKILSGIYTFILIFLFIGSIMDTHVLRSLQQEAALQKELINMAHVRLSAIETSVSVLQTNAVLKEIK